jgi:hypothetical protein
MLTSSRIKSGRRARGDEAGLARLGLLAGVTALPQHPFQDPAEHGLIDDQDMGHRAALLGFTLASSGSRWRKYVRSERARRRRPEIR